MAGRRTASRRLVAGFSSGLGGPVSDLLVRSGGVVDLAPGRLADVSVDVYDEDLFSEINFVPVKFCQRAHDLIGKNWLVGVREEGGPNDDPTSQSLEPLSLEEELSEL